MLARSALIAAILWSSTVAAQAPVPAPPPGSPHSGGFTPFRDRGFGGTAVDATVLEQAESPLRVTITRSDRDERGLILSLQLENLADGASSRQVLGAWVFAKDGTQRGYQKLEVKRAIAAGEARAVELVVRHATTQIVPGDLTVVAVQESAGIPPWRQDTATLQKLARAAAAR
jgi:hypothetical protein